MSGQNPIQWNEQHEVERDMNAIEMLIVDTHYQNYLVVLVDDEGKEHVMRDIDDARLREVLNHAKGKEVKNG